MSTNPLLLLLGVGPRIGSAVAKQFARHGYQVAVASRSGNNKRTEDRYFFIKADFSHSSSVPATFEAVNAEFGVAPSVVVYNAYSLTPPPKEDELFSVSTDVFATDMAVNTVSAYSAAAEAVGVWGSLPQDAQRTFIYTGSSKSSTAFVALRGCHWCWEGGFSIFDRLGGQHVFAQGLQVRRMRRIESPQDDTAIEHGLIRILFQVFLRRSEQ